MKTNSEGSNVRKSSYLVYLSVLSAQMGSISLGCTLGWSGPAFGDMARNDSIPQLTNDNEYDINMKTWIGSSMTLGALFGGMLCGVCIEFLGYKKTMILIGIPNSIGWLLLSFGREIWILIIGRIITGTCSGIIIGVVPAYVTDVSTPDNRGLLGTAMNFFAITGIIYMDVLFIGITWNYTSLAAIVPAIILSVSFFFIPESPNWLMSKFGRTIRVVEALHRLRHHTSDIEKELDELEQFTMNKKAQSQGFNAKILLREDVYKPIIIGVLLTFFLEFSGLNALQFYMADIFKDSGSSLKPQYAVITVNSSMLLSTAMAGVLADRLGRKILLLISCTCHTLSMAVMGYYYFSVHHAVYISQNLTTIMANHSNISSLVYSDSVPEMSDQTSVIPVICLVVFFIGFSLGYGSVIWCIIAEMSNPNSVGLVMSFCSSMSWLFTFIVTKEFEDIARVAQKYGVYWIFSGISALSILFVLYLPETKGKTVDELQRILYPKLYENQNNNQGLDQKQFPRHEISVL